MRFIPVLLVTLFATRITVAAETTKELRDIATHRHKVAILELVDRGIVHGYDDDTFRPNAPINRAEFLKILMLAVFGEEIFNQANTRCFKDFGETEEWYYLHACAAKTRGIVHGHPDGTFRGETTVNLAEALKMSMEAWNIPLPQYVRAPDHWYDPYMDTASSRGIFRILPSTPEFPLTRGEAAALIVTMDEPLKVLDPSYSDPDRIVSSVPPHETPYNPYVPPLEHCGDGVVDPGEQCDDGNTLNNDGCSSGCYRVAEPVYHGSLRLEQRPLSGTSVTRGADDVTLLAFDAIAGRQDVVITRLKFKADDGSLNSAQNYRLYLDRDHDGKAEWLLARSSPQSGILAFSDITILVREGAYTRLELKADVGTSEAVNDFSIQFATDKIDYVEGVDEVDGEDVRGVETDNDDCPLTSICWIAVYTEPSRLISIGTLGSLFVTQDTSSNRSQQLLLGQESSTLFTLEMLASQEDITVTKITIDGGSSSIESLELYADGASVPIASARRSSCTTVANGRFCADTDFLIRKDQERRMAVRARLNTDTFGGVSGQSVVLSLVASSTGSVAIKAWGEASLMELNQNNGNSTAEGEIIIGRSIAGANAAMTAATSDTVAAKIVSIDDSHSDPDDTPIPSGNSIIGQFHISAAAHSNSAGGLNNVTIRTMIFHVTASNVALNASSFVLSNINNPSATASCSADGATGTITVTCTNLASSSVSTVIGQGQSIDLALHASVTNPQIVQGTSTLQVNLTNLGSRSTPGTIIWDDGVTTLQWVDVLQTTIRSVRYRSG